MEDGGLAHLEGQRKVAAKVVELGLDRREDPVVVEAGLADCDDQRIRRQHPDLRPALVVHAGRVVGMYADRSRDLREAVSGAASRRASATARWLEATFQPGTRTRSTPASRAAASTSSTSCRKGSACRWQWLSMSLTGGLSPMQRPAERRRSRSGGGVLPEPDLGSLSVEDDSEAALAGDFGGRLDDRAAVLLGRADCILE